MSSDRSAEIIDISVLLPPAEYRRLAKEAYEWPLDFFAVESNREREFLFTAGEWGSVPVYLGERADVISGSRDLTRRRDALAGEALDVQAVTLRLAQVDLFVNRVVSMNSTPHRARYRSIR